MKLRECKKGQPVMWDGDISEVLSIRDGIVELFVTGSEVEHYTDPDAEVTPLIPAPDLAAMLAVCRAAEKVRAKRLVAMHTNLDRHHEEFEEAERELEATLNALPPSVKEMMDGD